MHQVKVQQKKNFDDPTQNLIETAEAAAVAVAVGVGVELVVAVAVAATNHALGVTTTALGFTIVSCCKQKKTSTKEKEWWQIVQD